jgi:beta-galactosidase
LTTTLEIAGAPVDRHNVRFGFREWTWPDHRLYLNGVRWQIYTDLLYGDTPDATAELYKKTEQQGIRFYSGWYNPPFLLTQRQWLNRADELGFLVRSSGTGDGQVGQYTLVKEGKVDPEWAEHWLIQLEGWIRAQRNHPSIHLWTLENEIVYINSMNWGRGDIFEPLVTQASQLVSRLDPTRPNMVDGGRALKDMSLPVNGAHYNEMAPGMELRDYPDIAYNAREFWAKNLERGRWPLAAKKPTFHGESFFSEGYSPADLAQIGGEKCFLGRGYTAEAIGTFARMLNEGWRWNDVAGAHHWFRGGKGLHVNAGRPISIGERVWSRTWPTGRPISLPMKLYNQTPSAEPITVRWSLAAGSQSFGSGEQTFSIRPGEEASFTPTLGPLSATSRVDAVWTLTAHRAGREVYREQRPISVLPDPIPRRQNRPRVTVIDPEGSVIRWLQREGRPFQSVPSLADLTRPDRVVLIGRGVLKAEDSANPALLRLAAQGHRVVVLEQDHPLRYAGLPTDAEPSAFDGRIAFLENPSHPILAGLQDSDLFCPTDDHLAYRRAYRKPTRSARSLVQCDRQLNYSALLECPVDDGLLILCQLTVASKLGQAPFASRALANMLDYAQSYQRRVQPVSSLLATQDTRTAMLRRAGLSPQPATGLPKAGIAVVDGGKESLAKIGPGAARKFAESGGTLVVWGVTPESLPEFNRMVGVEHLIRPFEMERVEVGLPRDPLAAGMSQRDVTIQSADSMFGWANYPWPDRDVFTFVVDAGPDLAPFLRFPSLESLGRTTIADRPQDTRTYNDGWPRNMVNGFNSADGWTLAYTTAKGQRFEFGVPAARRLSEFSIQFNDTFNRVTRLNLYVDGDPNPIVFRPEPGVDRQDFGIDPPRSVTEKLVLEIAEIEKTKDNELVGIDNLWLGVARPPATTAAVKPLLNVGGLVRYPVGKGQIVLCQLKVMEREPNPVNTDKKTALVRTLFDNLRADFGGLRTIVPGAELAYAPVPFPVGKANAYLRGTPPQPWFDQTDFSAFPTGNQVLAQVPFVVNDFRTSPVPGAIMLKGPGSAADVDEVSGLTVGQAADALFFLHAFRADDRFRNLRDDAPPPVAFAYRVRYQDGEEVTVPVVLGRGVAHWRQPNPQPLPEASLAWSGPVAGGEPGAVYLFQWNNPRPKVPIASVTLANAPGDERPGSPALLGITAARRP